MKHRLRSCGCRPGCVVLLMQAGMCGALEAGGPEPAIEGGPHGRRCPNRWCPAGLQLPCPGSQQQCPPPPSAGSHRSCPPTLSRSSWKLSPHLQQVLIEAVAAGACGSLAAHPLPRGHVDGAAHEAKGGAALVQGLRGRRGGGGCIRRSPPLGSASWAPFSGPVFEGAGTKPQA